MTKIALVQFKADIDKYKNLKKITDYITKAAKRGAKLCAFPEFMMCYTPSSQSPKELANLAETITGEFVSTISKSAKQNSIQVVGTIYEKSPMANRVYDTSFLINERGKVVSKYRKIHLYDALGMKESKKLYPGSQISKPIKTTLGTIGMMICYDLRFPEMSRTLASAGSEFLVVDPYGKILLDMKKKEGIGIVDVSLERIKQIRKKLPLLKNRRTDIYTNFKCNVVGFKVFINTMDRLS